MASRVRRQLGRIRRRLPARVRRPLEKSLRAWRSRNDIAVSVIVPVYNAMPDLPELLASLDRQGIGDRHLEIVLVNDGSTDGSTELLRSFSRSHRNVVLIEQPNSGWPGGPRNRAMAIARGRWFFFADGDDFLADGALAELVAFADTNGSDVVLPRVAPVGARSVGRAWDTTTVSILPAVAFRSFTPHKLIRADFVRRHGLVFPEGKVRLEDGIFFSRAYLLAKRISVLGDRDLYHLRARPARENISFQPIDAVGYTNSVRTIAATVNELTEPGKRRDKLHRVLVRRKVMRFYEPKRFLEWYPRPKQQAFVTAHQALLNDLISPEVDAGLPSPLDRRCAQLRAGDLEAIIADLTELRHNAASTEPTGQASEVLEGTEP